MGKFREETLIRIRNDYNMHKPSGRGSFLYQYLLEGKMKEKCANAKTPEEIDSIIHKAATDYMYNLGYPLSENTLSKAKCRSHNTTLDMIDAWYSMQGNDMTIAQGGGTEDFDPEVYQQLYDFLNTTGNTTVLIPVRVDNESGRGFYIVGRDHYAEFPYDNPCQSCGIGLLSLWCSDYDLDPENRRETLYLTFDTGTLEKPIACPNIIEANKWYTYFFGRDEDRYFSFQEYNGTAPDGLPNKFKKYFKTEEEDSFNTITEAEWKQAKKEVEEN